MQNAEKNCDRKEGAFPKNRAESCRAVRDRREGTVNTFRELCTERAEKEPSAAVECIGGARYRARGMLVPYEAVSARTWRIEVVSRDFYIPSSVDLRRAFFV